MSEGGSDRRDDPASTGGETHGVDEDVRTNPDESKEKGAAPIAEEGEHGQTQTPAPPDDAGAGD